MDTQPMIGRAIGPWYGFVLPMIAVATVTACGTSRPDDAVTVKPSDNGVQAALDAQGDMLEKAANDARRNMGMASGAGGDKTALETDSSYAAAKQNIDNALKDSSSARFRDTFVSRISGGNLVLCGKVNSKNSLGAYTGYKGFIAHPDPSIPPIIDRENGGYGVRDPENLYASAYQQFCSHPVERF